MSIEDLRKKIDSLDQNIIRLIAGRMKIAGDIGSEKLKKGMEIIDVNRENQILNRVKELAGKEQLEPEDVEKIYRQGGTHRGVSGPMGTGAPKSTTFVLGA